MQKLFGLACLSDTLMGIDKRNTWMVGIEVTQWLDFAQRLLRTGDQLMILRGTGPFPCQLLTR